MGDKEFEFMLWAVVGSILGIWYCSRSLARIKLEIFEVQEERRKLDERKISDIGKTK